MPSELKEEKEGSWFKKNKFFLSLLSIILLTLIILSFITLFLENPLVTAKPKTCGDSSFYDSCSIVKPYYCESGSFVEKASICDCPELSERSADSCTTGLQKEPEKVTLKYTLGGEEKELEFTAYKGLTDYLSGLSGVISYTNGEKPTRAAFSLKKINEQEQRNLLLPLVIKIQNLTNDKDDQARIAISLVQNIKYGFSEKTSNFFGSKVNYSRYPYEVLYEGEGICGEKSELLAFLLKELGYGVVLFYNQEANHEFVGIKCPIKESYKETGYCFVETTGPAIITDDSIEYVGGIKLQSDPEVISISEGNALSGNIKEYGDAETMSRIRQGKFVLFRNSKLEELRQRYGLVEEYNPA